MYRRTKVKLWLLLLGMLLSLVFIKPGSCYTVSSSLRQGARDLDRDLGQLGRTLADMERDISSQEAVTTHLEKLDKTMNHLGQAARQVRDGFAAFSERLPVILKDKALQQLARRRQAGAEADFEQRWTQLSALIAQLTQLKQAPETEQLAIIKACRQALGKLIVSQHNPLNVSNLPLKGVSWEDNSSPKIMLPALSVLPTAEDVASDPNTAFDSSIKKLAKELDYDPQKMYGWVKANIQYLPLFGSIKGAQRCFWDREGTDFDQAALLIELLRAAKIPARYVYGTMSLSSEAAAKWLGVDEPQAAQAILQRGGIPYQAGLIERVWVKAYLDNTWIEFDPAFKRVSWKNDTENNAAPSWMKLVDDEREPLQTALGISLPAVDSLKEGPPSLMIEPEEDDSTSTLAASITAREWEATKIPAEFQYWVKVELNTAQGTNSCSSRQLSMAQVLARPLSLLYLPIDTQEAKILEALTLQLADEVDAKSGKIGYMPGYLVKVRPHLLLGDEIIAKGEPVYLGTPQYLSVSFKSPLSSITPLKHLVTAGTCATLGLNMGGITLESLNSLEAEPASAGSLVQRLKNYVAELWNEELGLGVFKHTALAYHQQNGQLIRLLSQNNEVRAVPFMGEALVSQAAMVNYAFDIPVFFYYSGVNFDLQRNSFVITPLTDSSTAANQFLAQVGTYGSMLEHRVLEQIEDERLVNAEAVSAVKALMIAQRQDIPLFHITAENSDQIWPKLQLNQTILQDIEAAVSRGYEVTTSQREVKLNDWQGVGYVVWDTEADAGAYLINGGLAGSFAGTGGATTSITGSLPRSFWGKLIVIILILAVVLVLAAM